MRDYFKRHRKNLLVDIAIFFILIPLVQLLIFQYIPTQVKDSYFVLNTNSITLSSIFLQNYTHLAFGHIAGNLELYLIIMGLIFIMMEDRKRFYRDMGIIFFIAPFIISIATLYKFSLLNHAVNIYGFSGIVATLIGYFTYLFVSRLHKLSNNLIHRYFLLSSIFIINGGLTYQVLGRHDSTPFIIIIVGLALLLLFNIKGLMRLFKNIFLFLSKLRKNYAFLLVVVGGLFLCYFAIISLFLLPSLMEIENTSIGFTNIIGHFSGYVFGILIGYLHIFAEYISKQKVNGR
ncbi:MAG: hypothetical protein QW134_05615 [Nitrososphaeria archaeon]